MKQSIHVIIEIMTLPFKSERLLGYAPETGFFKRDNSKFYKMIIEQLVQQHIGGMSMDVMQNLISWCFFDSWGQGVIDDKQFLSEITKQLSHEFLEVDNSRIRLRRSNGSRLFGDRISASDRALAWRALCLNSSADLYFAAGLLGLGGRLGTDLHSSGILFDPWPNELESVLSLNIGLSENHMHSGSAFHPSALWTNFLLLLRSPKYREYLKIRPVTGISGKEVAVLGLCGGILRSLLQRHLFLSEGRLGPNFIEEMIQDSGAGDCADDIRGLAGPPVEDYPVRFLTGVLQSPKRQAHLLIPRLRKIFNCIHSHTLLAKNLLLNSTYTYKQELSFLFKCLDYLRSNQEDKTFALLFWDYIRTKNIYHCFLVQGNAIEGLSYFRENYFDSGKLLKPVRKNYFNNLSNLMEILDSNGRLEKIEIRTSPEVKDIRILQKGIEDHSKKNQQPDFGIVVHFVKKKIKLSKKTEYKDQLNLFSRLVLVDYLRLKHYVEKYHDMHNRPPRIVGIDVAGGEMDLPNWIFLAPFCLFREWWRKYIGTGSIGYTFHAGEDFYTLMQGLRHVGEILMFFPWEDGDRIGHGVSLALDAKAWQERHPVVTAPREVLMDDMLWELDLYSSGIITPPFPSIITRLEYEVSRMSSAIYGKSHPTRLLIDTYKTKYNIAGLYAAGLLHDFFSSEFSPTFENRLSGNSPEIELLKKTLSDSGIRKNCTTVESVYKCFSAEEEQQRLESIQNRLIDLCTEKNIAIESCPTSNLVIRNLHDYSEVPGVKMLHNGFPNLLINTDNPLTFATSLDEEYLHTYLALKKLGADNPGDIIRNCCNASSSFSFVC